jgi:imidazole glycerol-phosphate synthase subunit HisF
MVAKRIIPCLDVRAGRVVKGVQFKNHQDMGGIVELASRYADEGADELVLYDITASCEDRVVDRSWIGRVSEAINIPFCVAGGIRTVLDAQAILAAGADKISINSPALENPGFITELADAFGKQCVVVGIDSRQEGGHYTVHQYTGSESAARQTERTTDAWVQEVQDRGAGEIVLNCMNQDGMRQGYDTVQLAKVRAVCSVPLIASGGAGTVDDFISVFEKSNVDGALAASVFHSGEIKISTLKTVLTQNNIEVRPCSKP